MVEYFGLFLFLGIIMLIVLAAIVRDTKPLRQVRRKKRLTP